MDPQSTPLVDPSSPVFRAHLGGKLATLATQPLRDAADLSLLYTPGVAQVSRAIAADPKLAATYTSIRNTVAVISDGTAVLGLGDIGPLAAMPVMEGKAVLFKRFGGVDAVPLCMETGTVDELVDAIARVAPTYGGINLEDISAPRCFEIERRLQERLDIPVFHDDQHGTAIVVLAALVNAARVVGREIADLDIVVSGAGAAGVAVTKILLRAGVGHIVVVDSAGTLHAGRAGLPPHKQEPRDPHQPPRGRGRHRRGPGRRRRPGRRLGRHHPRECGRPDGPRRDDLRVGQPGPRGPSRRSPTGTRGSSPPAAPTSRTRSTTSSPSPGSSAAPWTAAPARSPRR